MGGYGSSKFVAILLALIIHLLEANEGKKEEKLDMSAVEAECTADYAGHGPLCPSDHQDNTDESFISFFDDMIPIPDSTSSSSDIPSFSPYYQLIKAQWRLHPVDPPGRVNDTTDDDFDTNCDGGTPFDGVVHDDLSVWRGKGGITREEFNEAKPLGIHYQMINGKLYREKDCMFGPRCKGVEHYLLKVIDKLPNMELIINVFDWPKSRKYFPPKPVFSFSKDAGHHDIMYPAWTFWCGGPAIATEPSGLGRWDLKRKSIRDAALEFSWTDKETKGFFRGSRTSAERDPLILLSRRKPDLVDAAYTKNQAWKSSKDTLNAEPAAIVRLEDHCKFKYLFNFRGVAASFRFKHLFLCSSLVFQVESDWREFFYDSMKPWVHYIPVHSNCTNIEELIEFAKNNEIIAKTIADRGFRFIWNHLTSQNIECYWRNLLYEYSKLTRWKPTRNAHFIDIR